MIENKKTEAIFVPTEVKEIVRFNIGFGKSNLGTSLVDLLEDSPKYRKLKEILKLAKKNTNDLDMNVSLNDLLNSKEEIKDDKEII